MNGYPRKTGLDITAASEVMAILAVCRDLAALRRRLGAIAVGYSYDDARPVTAEDTSSAPSIGEVRKAETQELLCACRCARTSSTWSPAETGTALPQSVSLLQVCPELRARGLPGSPVASGRRRALVSGHIPQGCSVCEGHIAREEHRAEATVDLAAGLATRPPGTLSRGARHPRPRLVWERGAAISTPTPAAAARVCPASSPTHAKRSLINKCGIAGHYGEGFRRTWRMKWRVRARQIGGRA